MDAVASGWSGSPQLGRGVGRERPLAGEGVPELGRHQARGEEQGVELGPGRVHRREFGLEARTLVLLDDVGEGTRDHRRLQFGELRLEGAAQPVELVDVGVEARDHRVEAAVLHRLVDLLPGRQVDHAAFGEVLADLAEVDLAERRQVGEAGLVHLLAERREGQLGMPEFADGGHELALQVAVVSDRIARIPVGRELAEQDVLERRIAQFEVGVGEAQVAREPGRVGQVGLAGLVVFAAHGDSPFERVSGWLTNCGLQRVEYNFLRVKSQVYGVYF